MAKETTKVTPEHTVRVGGIQLSVWPNQTEKGIYHNVTITKSYKIGDEYKKTNNFKPNDLTFILIGINKLLEYFYCKTVIVPEKVSEKTQDNAPF